MEFEGRSRIRDELGMAPLIDVVFQLLLFFMLTSTFVAPEAVGLTLPGSRSAAPAEPKPVTVELTRAGSVLVDGREVAIEELAELLRPRLQQSEDRTVWLRADGGADVQRMVSVVDEIRAAGGKGVALATEPRD